MAETPHGVLYVVATPIGNLEDITLRALRVLREADLIACEDTRHSRKLLAHFGIGRPLISCYRENERRRGTEILARLRAGARVALICDAGSPALSDPGAHLVQAAVEAGMAVIPVPGPSAAVAALMAAGTAPLPVVLLGFLPARAGARRAALAPWRGFAGTLILFEAPHRLLAALEDLAAVLGPERPLLAARELTKLHEELVRGAVTEVRAHFAAAAPRGEFTLVVGPAAAGTPLAAGALDAALATLATGAAGRDELRRLARETGLSRSELYRRWQRERPRD